MEIRIIRSARRRKTVSASMVEGRVEVRAPLRMPNRDLDPLVSKLVEKITRRRGTEDLAGVFDRLNDKYFGGRLVAKRIEYSAIQNQRYGSCQPRTGTIRLSHRLARMPLWVRDYVLVHEMAHLLEPNHGPAFWELCNRYRLTERARGFLLAKEYDEGEEGGESPQGELFFGGAP